MLCGTPPALVQVHVTVPPAAMVSTAGFADPLCPLLNTLLPTLTAAVGGAVPPPLSPPVGPPSGGGSVAEPPEQPASTARAMVVRSRLLTKNPPYQM